MAENGDSGIGAVKRTLPAEFSYGQIKVVAALMKTNLAWLAEAAPPPVAQVRNEVQEDIPLSTAFDVLNDCYKIAFENFMCQTLKAAVRRM